MNVLQRTIGATLAVTITLAGPANAAVHQVVIDGNGRFTPKFLSIPRNDSIEWVLPGRTDAVAGLSTSMLDPVTGQLLAAASANQMCSAGKLLPPDPVTPSYHLDPGYANLYRRPYAGTDPYEPTGPTRNAVSGIWALGPEGGVTSLIEIPSLEASAIDPLIAVSPSPAVDSCNGLDRDYYHNFPAPLGARILRYDYTQHDSVSGIGPIATQQAGYTDPGDIAATFLPGRVSDPSGVKHALCEARTYLCDSAGASCVEVTPSPQVPGSVPPGTYMNGLLASTYQNPDVTGVVLRFNWNDLQYDAGNGVITEQFRDLDRELERAIAGGKLVTLDVRAGMYGTPSWIFTDYVTPGSGHEASWCTAAAAPCRLTGNPAAGHVTAIELRDHYDEDPPGTGCGTPMRIGQPGDASYRALYADFMHKLADHIASDTRYFQTVAHVKVSGANLQTSEAELPHHCDDLYDNTIDHHADYKGNYRNRDTANQLRTDRVLDVMKELTGNNSRKTETCTCNPQVWYQHGYLPEQLYDYYATVENQIVNATFGKKSLGYQIIQDGFPRARAPYHAPGGQLVPGSFFGDHLYQEVLEPWTQPFSVIPITCGNGTVDAAAGEECDDGNNVDNDGCRWCRSCGNGVVASTESCDDGNLVDGDGCDSDCRAEVNAGFALASPAVAMPVCTPTVDAGGFPTEIDGALLPQYCSSDTDRYGLNEWLALEPLVADPLHPYLAAFPGESPPGLRYPGPFDQSVEVLRQADQGRFATASFAGVDPVQGKLFVPQHSGIQVFPQERVAIHWAATLGGGALGCAQSATATRQPSGATWVAPFPIPASAASTPYWDVASCPNEWIVDQGKNMPNVGGTQRPPQLTGWQVPNSVRSPVHVESALMNLVYNSNGVFLELYEDSIWQIARTRNSGAGALPLDDAAHPVRLRAGNCVPNVTCYSKNLSQWADELHARRTQADTLWSHYLAVFYPGLVDPFPASYTRTFDNTTGNYVRYSFIDPAHCAPTLVDRGPNNNGRPSALGVIEVQP